MKLHGAVITERGVTFAIARVKPEVLNSNYSANETVFSLQSVFGKMPIILMAEDQFRRIRYYGRRDISNFLANIPVSCIPWREYTVH